MITRRSLMGVAAVAGVAKVPLSAITDAQNQWIKENASEYDPYHGMLGRGRTASVEHVVQMAPVILNAGFVPYLAPGHGWGDSRWLSVYGADGAPMASVWHAFVRERSGKHEIIAFEHSLKDLTEFKSRTGLTLDQAMKGTT